MSYGPLATPGALGRWGPYYYLGVDSISDSLSLTLAAAPRDGTSPDWLIAELTHRQAHGLKLQTRSRPRADTQDTTTMFKL